MKTLGHEIFLRDIEEMPLETVTVFQAALRKRALQLRDHKIRAFLRPLADSHPELSDFLKCMENIHKPKKCTSWTNKVVEFNLHRLVVRLLFSRDKSRVGFEARFEGAIISKRVYEIPDLDEDEGWSTWEPIFGNRWVVCGGHNLDYNVWPETLEDFLNWLICSSVPRDHYPHFQYGFFDSTLVTPFFLILSEMKRNKLQWC